MLDTDVLICGGGPAGLAAAIAIRRQGLSVVVADCLTPPIDKVCGEGLMPDALAALADLGITLEAADTGPFHGIRFVEGDRSVDATFPFGTARETAKGTASGVARGIRRTHLHDLLHRQAEQLGVRLLWGTQVLSISEIAATPSHPAHIITHAGSHEIRARWLIGADGIHSRVRHWAGLHRGTRTSNRIGLRRHYRIRPWSPFVEVHWGRTGQAYVTPVGTEEICIVAVARDRYASVAAALPHFPQLASRLCNAPPIGPERGALTAAHRYRRIATTRIALLGDASGSVDAITGSGLGLAFLQAPALARAIAANDLTLYRRAHAEIRRRPVLVSHVLLLMDGYPAIRSIALASFQRNPQLLERILAMHIGATPLKLWGRNGIASLSLELLCS